MSEANSANLTTAFSSSGRQKVRVFLEGREVPNVSVSFTALIDQPASCQISLPPLNLIKFVKPRTQVHVFVRDGFNFGDDDYYLAFEGEVMGRTMTKQHNARSFTLTAFDYSNYWDDAHVYMMNQNAAAGAIQAQVAKGEPVPEQVAKAQAGVTQYTSASSTSAMIQMLQIKDANGNVDLVTGVAHVISRMAFVNEFYRAAYERLRVVDRMTSYPSGNLGHFLNSLGIEDFLQSFAGIHSGIYSLRQMLMNILSLIFHNSTSVLFPSFLEEKIGTRHGKTIVQFLFIPDGYTLPPPKCNVIFPNQQSSFSFDEDFRGSPTRYGFRASFPLMSGQDTDTYYYPIQYYPSAFSDYMMGGKTATAAEIASEFGPSTLIKSKDGRNYANVFYGMKAKGNSVSTSTGSVLRQGDFLSNEESIKGIYYQTDDLLPGYSALLRYGVNPSVDSITKQVTESGGSSPASRNSFIQEIGQYLFYKKRYSARNVQASIMFQPFLVPGFNCLLLDDSEAGQSVIAKLISVTHSLMNDGFQTQIQLTLGRDFDEIDFMSGGLGEPPLPGWFDTNIFGQQNAAGKELFDKETKYLSNQVTGAFGTPEETKKEVDFRNKYVKNPTVYPNLSKFYQKVLGCDAITYVGKAPPAGTTSKLPQEVYVTTRGATQALLQKYKNTIDPKKRGSPAGRDQFVRDFIRRPVTRMVEAFFFVGAAPSTTPTSTSGGQTFPDEFATVSAITDPKLTQLPGRFDGTGYSDEAVLKVRRQVIDSYRQMLQQNNGGGFRG